MYLYVLMIDLCFLLLAEVGVVYNYEFLDVFFDGPVFLRNLTYTYCSYHPTCSCSPNPPPPTACTMDGYVCLNLTVGTGPPTPG